MTVLLSWVYILEPKSGEKLDNLIDDQPGSPILPIQSSNWSATDALGRSLPMYDKTGPFRQNRYVGIFYFLWQGAHSTDGIYDITELIKLNPSKPAFGPSGAFHWWGKPEAGYYKLMILGYPSKSSDVDNGRS